MTLYWTLWLLRVKVIESKAEHLIFQKLESYF